MLLRRFFERARTRSSSDTNKQICLCTTAKRDSMYDDPTVSLTKTNERPSADQYGFVRTDKPKRLIRQASLDESDGEDDMSITDKLRRASSQSPANIPMLVVVSFNPDAKGLQKKQIEIQRGYPVNAQYILNEWLCIKTADDEEGFVPYLCCRPMFRRQPTKCSTHIENSYKPYDFESNKSHRIKSPPTNIPTAFTPPANKKNSLTTHLCSPTYLFQKSSPYKKRQDLTSSSCGGDSGVSDCESSSHNHPTLDSATARSTRLSNIRSLRLSTNAIKKTGLIVQDLPLRKSAKPNVMKSQLSISSNSAFTQIVRRKQRQESSQQRQLFHPNNRSFNYDQEILPPPSSSSNRSHFHRLYDSYDETTTASSSSAKYLTDNHNMILSANVRQTPYVRRSLPHHIQSVVRKPLYNKSSSSPDPFKTIKEQQLRHIVLAEPSLPPAIIPSKVSLERHFSDLSLNQIENDSLSPSTPLLLVHNRPSFSCSSSSSSSSSSTANSSTDDSTTPFIHIQMNNYRAGRIPVIYTSSNINHNNSTNPPTKSNSFIHNVSITV